MRRDIGSKVVRASTQSTGSRMRNPCSPDLEEGDSGLGDSDGEGDDGQGDEQVEGTRREVQQVQHRVEQLVA